MAGLNEKDLESGLGPNSPAREPTHPKEEPQTAQHRSSSEEEDTPSEPEENPGFEPIRPAGTTTRPGSAARRLSKETISTLRRERSNNGWGVDDIEEGTGNDAGSVIAPYHHPNPDPAAPHDPFEVGWDGGDSDELCPRSMPTWRKWVIIGITSVGSFCV